MNRELIAAKARQMAENINAAYGTRALFRGQEIRLAIAAQDSSMSLEHGGFRESASFRIRIPASVQPPPDLKEKIYEIGTDRTFFIVGVRPAGADATLAQEHIADAELS